MVRHTRVHFRSVLTAVVHECRRTVARYVATKAPAIPSVIVLATSLVALAATMAGPAAAQSVAIHVVSDGTAKYSEAEIPGWEALAFDDSAWQFVAAPSIGLCGTPSPVPPGAPNNIWGQNPQDFQTVFVRKSFTLAAPAIVNIIAGADDDYDLFVNGELVGSNNDGFPSDDLYLDVPLQAGLNVVAMRATDTSGGCQALKFDVFTPPAPPLNDDRASAIVIPALDFADALDTGGRQSLLAIPAPTAAGWVATSGTRSPRPRPR